MCVGLFKDKLCPLNTPCMFSSTLCYQSNSAYIVSQHGGAVSENCCIESLSY